MLDLEEALRRLASGRSRRWQFRAYAVFLVTQAIYSWSVYSRVFIFDTPSFHCKLPPNATLNASIPREFVNGNWRWSECKMFTNHSLGNRSAVTSCTNGYQFDDTYDSTLVTEWNLVCSRDALTELPMSIENVGHLMGALLLGHLSDVIGRKPVFLFTLYSGTLLYTLSAFAPNLATYCVIVFIRGCLSSGLGGICVIMSLELFPPEKRTLAGLGIHLAWVVGSMLYSPLAYWLRNWRLLTLASEVPKISTLYFIWVVIESPTWLLTQHRYREVETILRKAAKMNGVKLPEHLFATMNADQPEESPQQPTLKALLKEKASLICYKIKEPDQSSYGFLDLVRTRRMRTITAIFSCLWFSHTFIYRSMALSVTYLHGNRYVNYFLYELFEVPVYIVAYVAMNKIGRRLPLCALQVASGVFLIATVVQQFHIAARLDWLITSMNIFGKVCAAGSTSILWLMTPETFPTALRTRGLAVCGTLATVAGFLAPYTRTFAREVSAAVPPVVFGIMSFLFGALSLWLPETLGRNLPETVDEIERWTSEKTQKSDKQILVEMDFVDVENDTTAEGATYEDFQPNVF